MLKTDHSSASDYSSHLKFLTRLSSNYPVVSRSLQVSVLSDQLWLYHYKNIKYYLYINIYISDFKKLVTYFYFESSCLYTWQSFFQPP